MYFYSLIENCQLRIAALKFEFGCGFYFCVISALKYIIGYYIYNILVFIDSAKQHYFNDSRHIGKQQPKYQRLF